MELLETDDPVKGRLLKKSGMHQKLIQDDIKGISDQAQKVLTTALVVGGALALSYVLVSGFFGSSKGKKKQTAKIKVVPTEREEKEYAPDAPEQPNMLAQIGTALASQAAVFLLSIAKEKLLEYLNSESAKNAGKNEPSK